MRVFYVHWNKGEALDSVRNLRSLGHVVRCHADCGPQACSFLAEWKPEVLVVSLAKLPMEGPHWTSMVKAAAEFARVPLVFAGGNEERVAAARAAFDGANLSSFDKLPQVLAAAVEMARAVASSPVIESRPSVRTAAG